MAITWDMRQGMRIGRKDKRNMWQRQEEREMSIENKDGGEEDMEEERYNDGFIWWIYLIKAKMNLIFSYIYTKTYIF